MLGFIKKWFGKKMPDEEPVQVSNEIVVTERETIALASMVFEGRRTGEYYVREIATVRTNANVEGSIVSGELVIRGRVNGNIVCVGSIWIGYSGIVEGNIVSKNAVIEPGAIINGILTIDENVSGKLLEDKIRKAESLLNKGYESKVEPLEEIEEAKPEVATASGNVPERASYSRRTNEPPPVANDADGGGGNWW